MPSTYRVSQGTRCPHRPCPAWKRGQELPVAGVGLEGAGPLETFPGARLRKGFLGHPATAARGQASCQLPAWRGREQLFPPHLANPLLPAPPHRLRPSFAFLLLCLLKSHSRCLSPTAHLPSCPFHAFQGGHGETGRNCAVSSPAWAPRPEGKVDGWFTRSALP